MGVWSGVEGRRPPPPEMATAAVGTHPTGMHSCLPFFALEIQYDECPTLSGMDVFRG